MAPQSKEKSECRSSIAGQRKGRCALAVEDTVQGCRQRRPRHPSRASNHLTVLSLPELFIYFVIASGAYKQKYDNASYKKIHYVKDSWIHNNLILSHLGDCAKHSFR